MRRNLPILLCLAARIGPAFGGEVTAPPAAAPGGIVNEIVFAQRYCDGGDGSIGDPWWSRDGTGCVERALRACVIGVPPGPAPPPRDDTAGCRIVLPKGFIKVTSTIDTSRRFDREGAPAATRSIVKYGLVVEGHGAAIMYENARGAFAGSALIWAGPDGGTVLKIFETSYSVFENFSIVGGLDHPAYARTRAGIGIDMTTPWVPPPGLSPVVEKNVLRNIHVENILGVPGIGIRVGMDDPSRTRSPEIDSITLDGISVRRCKVGAEQNGGQTTNVHWRDSAFELFTDAGLDLYGADVHVQGCSFISPERPVDAGRRADVRVHATGTTGAEWTALWALFQDNVHETYFGSAYLFCDGVRCGPTREVGAHRFAPTTFLNDRVYWWGPDGGSVIDYRHGGPLNLVGCTFDLPGSNAAATAFVDVTVPAADLPTAGPTAVTSLGSYYVRTKKGGAIRMALHGDAALVSNDNALQIPTPSGTRIASIVRGNGLVLEDGSLEWKSKDAPSALFRQRLDADGRLTLADGEGAPLAAWTRDGGLELRADAPKLTFRETSLVAAHPEAAATVALPAVDGTLVVSNRAAALACGEARIDPSPIAAGATGIATATAGTAPVAAHDVCSCVPRGDWGGPIVPKYCLAGTGTLEVVLWNGASGGDPFDPPERTVDYCCVKK